MIVAVSSVLAGQLVGPPEIALCPHPNVHSNGQIRESPIPESRVRVTALAVEFDFQYRTPTQEGLFLRKEALQLPIRHRGLSKRIRAARLQEAFGEFLHLGP
jgi:hypothetical protein